MKPFNRGFAAFVALCWLAALAAVIYLMWAPDRTVDINGSHLRAAFAISLAGSDRILATLVALAAMLPALALIGLEARPEKRRDAHDPAVVAAGDERYRKLDERISALQHRVDDRDSAPARRPVTPSEPVAVRESFDKGPPRRRWPLLGG
jgi:hypothetical protein